LLRQYLPRGEDLSGYSQQQLDEIAASFMLDQESRWAGKPPLNFSCQKGYSTSKNIGLHQTQSPLLRLVLESAKRKNQKGQAIKETCQVV
jgi:hypothetical protein